MVAADAQGAEVARPWVEKANGTYRALIDQHNVLGNALNLKYVPAGIVLDESGRLARAVGGMSIDQDAFREEMESWAQTGQIPGAWIESDRQAVPKKMSPDEAEADSRFQLAVLLLERGKKDDAVAEFKRAFRLDPQNWLIRKQLWAVEHPESFYDGNVDYGWQKEQMEREKAELEGSD